MKLDFIALDKLVVASTNMRAKGRDPMSPTSSRASRSAA